jgi:hypothetical protein
MVINICLPKREMRHGGGAAGSRTPRQQPTLGSTAPCPPSSLDLLRTVDDPSPLEMAA